MRETARERKRGGRETARERGDDRDFHHSDSKMEQKTDLSTMDKYYTGTE